MDFLDFGGTIVSILAPDRAGRLGNIVPGYGTVGEYESGKAYYGALVGRYANRIAGSRFALDGREYRLTANDGRNQLHGGYGFHRRIWTVSAGESSAELAYRSPDGEDGYPGLLDVRVTYTLDAAGSLAVTYRATSDKATPINLTQHTYFNLSAGAVPDIRDHVLTIAADRFVPVDTELIPTGELAAVDGTVLDFRQPASLRSRLASGARELATPKGFDHCYVLPAGNNLKHAARLIDPGSGRSVELATTEPGMQLYTGNWLPEPHSSLTLEAQHFPDSPNRPEFPSTILRPGEEFRSTTIYRFGVVS